MTDAYLTFAERMFQKDSKYIPEILKSLVNDEQAELLVSLPGTAAEIDRKSVV